MLIPFISLLLRVLAAQTLRSDAADSPPDCPQFAPTVLKEIIRLSCFQTALYFTGLFFIVEKHIGYPV